MKEAYVREDEIPFDFTRRRMSVVLRDKEGKRQLITKDAVEEMLSICSFVEIDGEVKPLTPELAEGAQKIPDENNAEGIISTSAPIPPGTLRLTKRKAPKRLMARSPPLWGWTAPSVVGTMLTKTPITEARFCLYDYRLMK